MNFFKNIGIHARILSVAVIIVCLTTIFMGYSGVSIIKKIAENRFSRQMEFMAEYLAANSELGLLVNQPEQLKSIAEKTLAEDEISKIKIKNTKGLILVDLEKKIKGPFRDITKNVMTKDIAEASIVDFGNDSPGNKIIGAVELTYSTSSIRTVVLEMKKKLVFTASSFAVLASIVFLLISSSLVSPLSEVVSVAKEVSAGNRNIRAPYGNTPETRRLAASFNHMLDSLAENRAALIKAHDKMSRQESLAELGKFSMMIAHEFKNPLGIIRSSMELMKKDLKNPDENIGYQYAIEEVLRLNELIESFLMFSGPTNPKFCECDLNSVAYQVILGFEIKYSEKNLEIEYEIPDSPFNAEADFNLISRALSNLVKNACEANNEKGIVRIKVDNLEDKWCFSVMDNGAGVKEEIKDKIFEPFYTEKAKGTGLGLAFVDHVVKAHGGEINIENLSSGGAAFKITVGSETIKESKEDLV